MREALPTAPSHRELKHCYTHRARLHCPKSDRGPFRGHPAACSPQRRWGRRGGRRCRPRGGSAGPRNAQSPATPPPAPTPGAPPPHRRHQHQHQHCPLQPCRRVAPGAAGPSAWSPGRTPSPATGPRSEPRATRPPRRARRRRRRPRRCGTYREPQRGQCSHRLDPGLGSTHARMEDQAHGGTSAIGSYSKTWPSVRPR